MPTFILQTRLATGALASPRAFLELEQQVKLVIASQCPGVEWIASYAVLGPTDYLDVFRAPDLETAIKVAAVMRTFGHATTELWPATEWKRFKEIVATLPEPVERPRP